MAAARLALELDGAATHQHLDTLAAAYASGGDFDSASAVLAQAIEEAPQGTTDQYRVRLALYEQGQPYLSQPRSIPSADGEQATYGARPQPQESVTERQPRPEPPTSATSGQTKPHRHLVPGSSQRGQ